MDYHLTVPGFQSLPNADVEGHWRSMDGNGDSTATEDMGAYGCQGQSRTQVRLSKYEVTIPIEP